jgi:hypothetical protein
MNDLALWLKKSMVASDRGIAFVRALRPRMRWAFVTVACVGATLPVGLSVSRDATARGVATQHERLNLYNAFRSSDVFAIRASDPASHTAGQAVDGRDDTAWSGRPGESDWRWTSLFSRPIHLGLIRAHFGFSPTSGVPTDYRWEVLRPAANDTTCDDAPSENAWSPLDGTLKPRSPWSDSLAQPTRRSWFVDADACGLRIIVARTNAGPPVVRELQAIESARNVLEDGTASDDGAFPGFRASSAIDGSYAARWAGAEGKSRWTLRVDLRERQTIDRIRLVLGFDATSVPRPGGGRGYALAWAPLHYTLEVSEDGKRFEPVAEEPVRADGTPLLIRRRMVALREPRSVTAIQLVMVGATDATGRPGGLPVVRELAAYGADDPRPILAAPWILSVNANPSLQSRRSPGGEVTNDAYHAKFLQNRLSSLVPALRADDRYARSLGPFGEPLDAPPHDEAGQALEVIEGDDPQLDARWLAASSPPPIVILSGSNDWDYAESSGPVRAWPKRWQWNPLLDAREGGMGQLAAAVQNRVAPFIGFCGGAQILALLEAHGGGAADDDGIREIDRILQRTRGGPIRGFALPADVERSWPLDPQPRHTTVQFDTDDPLFTDLAGASRRSRTEALPEWHSDSIRLDAFSATGPLRRFKVVATSAFCGPDVQPTPNGGGFADPNGNGWCTTVPEAFRSQNDDWPVIGAQFHAEQRDFVNVAPGDPPESTADPRLFLAAAYEQIIDAYLAHSR